MVPRLLSLGLAFLAINCGEVTFADQPTSAVFFRGVNLFGPSLMIDGHFWHAGDSPDLVCNGQSFENQSVTLHPSTDSERARMIRSSRWGRAIDVDLMQIPAGDYQIFVYVWEDNDPTTYSIFVNGRKVIGPFASGAAGSWKRLGPWPVRPNEGCIRISAQGGDANLSGIEIWSGTGPVPDPHTTEFNLAPNAEQLAFFESKIRPTLIEKCYRCHSQDAQEVGGNLLLDSHAAIVKGGDTGPPLVPGDPDASLLIRAIRQTDPNLKMPPEGKLTNLEIADMEQWVRWRAPDPRSDDTLAKRLAGMAIDWESARDFWSLKALSAPAIPSVADKNWPLNDIDRFVLTKLEAAGLRPADDAPKAVLLRRVTYDLTGLPPTPQEMSDFENDDSPGAYAKVVDRLLDSASYGERWGRHWLDVVRYSDTAGDNSDFPIPQMYLYRDWVIDAFNRDLPYDEFVREQLAGDLIGADTPEEARRRLIATGYIANSRRFGSRVDDYPWHLTIEDTLDNLGRTFLATTLNCARCHNHKFDPVTTDDYYGLYGIFHSTRFPWPGIELQQYQRDLVPLVPNEEAQRLTAEHRQQLQELETQTRELEKRRDAAADDERKTLEKSVAEARQKVEHFSRRPLPFAQAYAMAEAASVEDVPIHIKGDPAKPGPLVRRHFLTMLHGNKLPDEDKTSGRLQLANWIVDPANPLTARVMVNRIWTYHFGRGLVSTPNDFGRQGRPPTHPELLDHLATQFIESRWSIKAMHRQMLISHTYRQSGKRSEPAVGQDASNELLSGYPRRRLDAEALRDTMLALSGRLDLSPGGPHPFPPQTEWKFTQHNPFKAIYETNHRSVYLMTQRTQRHPYLAIFDGADPSTSTPYRLASTTPLQSLYLLNDAFVHDQAAELAQRVLTDRNDPAERLKWLYRLTLSREPNGNELHSAQQFLVEVSAQLGLENASNDAIELQSWQALVRTLFRLNEFMYID